MILPAKGFLEKPNNFFAIKDFMVIPPFFLIKTHSTIPNFLQAIIPKLKYKIDSFLQKCFLYIMALPFLTVKHLNVTSLLCVIFPCSIYGSTACKNEK